jgi:diguanylate cyclase (GGDEF)-like protein
MAADGAPIRILLVGQAKEACRIRFLLDAENSRQFHIAHVPQLDLAAERLSDESADILLLDVGAQNPERRAFVQSARVTAPDTPMVVLSEDDDQPLALESLRLGAQDFVTKDRMRPEELVRAMRFAIERHKLQKNLQNLTLIDDLTRLHNRRGFMALAEQHLRMIQRKGAALLIYVDLDDLKIINDSCGHPEGNRALIVAANVLRACFRQSDILARLGGDEFCVLMTDAAQDSAAQVRKRLQERLDFVNALSSWGFRLSLSVGFAEVPAVQQPSLEQLLRMADLEMYREKREKQMRGTASPAQKQTANVS